MKYNLYYFLLVNSVDIIDIIKQQAKDNKWDT